VVDGITTPCNHKMSKIEMPLVRSSLILIIPSSSKHFENELVDEKLLCHLSEMAKTLRRVKGDKDIPWTSDDRICSMMCHDLLTVGYSTIKNKMDRGDQPVGDLHYRSALKIVCVGPVSEFIMLDEATERMRCWNQKAIKIMERYPDSINISMFGIVCWDHV